MSKFFKLALIAGLSSLVISSQSFACSNKKKKEEKDDGKSHTARKIDTQKQTESKK